MITFRVSDSYFRVNRRKLNTYMAIIDRLPPPLHLRIVLPEWGGPERDNARTRPTLRWSTQRKSYLPSHAFRSSSSRRSYFTRRLPPTSSLSHGLAGISVRRWCRILSPRLSGNALGRRRHPQSPIQPSSASLNHSWLISSMVRGNARYVLRCVFTLLVPIFCSRHAVTVQTICIHRFPPGYAFAETPAVARNCRQSTGSTSVPLD